MFAAVACSLVDLAGLRDLVRVIVGTGADGIEIVAKEGTFQGERAQLGMIFLDHHKPSYESHDIGTSDLELYEHLGLVGSETVGVDRRQHDSSTLCRMGPGKCSGEESTG
jgi:catechol O-methyltransferase